MSLQQFQRNEYLLQIVLKIEVIDDLLFIYLDTYTYVGFYKNLQHT